MKIYSDISLIDVSQSISANQNTFVLVRGSDGTIRRAPLTVNGATMNDNGNIAAGLTAIITGLSSSLSGSPLFLADTYSPRPPVSGTLFVVSGETGSASGSNGEAYIFVTSSFQSGSWQQIFGFNYIVADERYVKLSSGTAQNISSPLNITGSVTFITSSATDKITFSSSLYWLSGSHGATTPGVSVTAANVVVLGNDGRLYITGAYGTGGSGTPSAPLNSVQFNNNSTFGGNSSFLFTPPTTSSIPSSSGLLELLGRETISGSLILRNPADISGSIYTSSAWTSSLTLQVIGTSSFTGSTTFTTSSASSRVTFSSSLYWLSGSHGAIAPGTSVSAANVVVLGNDGRLYITGAYGAGGVGSPGNPNRSIQFNNNTNFGGDSTLLFTSPLNSSIPISSSLVELLGRETISGSLVLRNPASIPGSVYTSSAWTSSLTLQVIGTSSFTGSLIVSNSLQVIGTEIITGSLIVSNSFQTIGTGIITGSLIVSNSLQVIGTGRITGSLIVSNSLNVIGTGSFSGSVIISSSLTSSNALQIIGSTVMSSSLTGSSARTVLNIMGPTDSSSLIVSGSTVLRNGTTTIQGSSTTTGNVLVVNNSASALGTNILTISNNRSSSLYSDLSLTGSMNISSSIPGQKVLQITGTGSATTAPMVQIAGQTGAFVQVYDFNSGSLFSVNNNTGTPILDVISNGQTLIGSNAYQGMYDSTGYALMPSPGQVLTIPGYLTSSYNALWFEYFTNSGSYSRTGTFTTIWSGSNISYIDITGSTLGTLPTNNIQFTASISGQYVQLIASASTNGWLIKGLIRGI